MPLDSPFDIPFTTKFSKMLRSFTLIKFWQARNAVVYSEYFLVFECCNIDASVEYSEFVVHKYVVINKL